MTDRSVRVGIDLGTSTTVGCLRRGDGPITPLLFDASPLLSSAVMVDADGTLLTGADAVRAAAAHPESFEPSPKHRIDDDTVWLGDRAVPAVDLLAAVLRRVGDEARRVAGAVPGEVVLTCPAGWSRTRLAVLAEAARRAGLGEVRFIREPVAAAAYFAAVLGHELPPGQCLVVYDFGAGTFDVSVVRPMAGGVEVIAADGLTDVGGNDLDALVVELVRPAVPSDAWARMDWPSTPDDRRGRRMLWSDARAAKEQLSRHSVADVHLPLAGRDAHVTREEFERAARACLNRTVQLTVETLRSAGVERQAVGGVLLVGGSSRVPLVASLVHRALGIAPTIIEQPELVVAYGSLHAPTELPTAAFAAQEAQQPEPPPPLEPTSLTTPAPVAPDPVVGMPDRRASAAAEPENPGRLRHRVPVFVALVALLGITAGGTWYRRQDPAAAGPGARPSIAASALTGTPSALSTSTAASGAPSSVPPGAKSDGPTKTATATSSPRPAITSVSRHNPGCQEKDSRIVWNAVRAGLSCSSSAVTLTKTVGWDDGYFQSYAELHMSVRDQQFPAQYTVSATIAALSAPDVDPAVNHGGCAGIAVHATANGTAYDYFNVCRDGFIEIVRVTDHNVLQTSQQTRQITPAGESPSYDVTVGVTATAVTVTVSNRAGDTQSVTSSAVRSATSYVALLTTWRNVGAAASFSNFLYTAGN